MAEFLGEFVVGLLQLALECCFAGMQPRSGCIVSAAALWFLLCAGVLFVVALAQADQSRQVSLVGLACCSGGLFVVTGITAAFLSGGEPAER
jgi:hypothetical protein